MLASYQLTVPNTPASPALVFGFVHGLALRTGMNEREADALADVARLAAQYVILYGYPENRADELHAYCDISRDNFQFRLRDHGLPKLPPETVPTDSDESALLAQLKTALSGVQTCLWTLKGFEGKELLVRYTLRQEPLADVLARGAQLRRPTRAQPTEEASYVVRPFEDSDAAAITELVYRTYGVSYDDEDYYYPERILAENRSKAMVSVVALHPEGEVVGHYALEMRDMEGIYEGSSAVVNPLHRGRHLMERMRALAVDEARAIGIKGLTFLPWTIHVFSQKANEHFGAHLVGVNLSDSAPVAILGVEAESLQHRVSTLLYYTSLHERPSRPMYVPPKLQPMVAEILNPLDGHVDFQGDAATVTGKTVLRSREWPRDRFAEIVVDAVGADACAEIEAEVRRVAVHEHMETVFINLPMSCPACPALAAHAETLGFGFIGVGPDFCAGSDALRMALLSSPVDESYIQVYSPFGKRLLQFALAEQRRLSAVM